MRTLLTVQMCVSLDTPFSDFFFLSDWDLEKSSDSPLMNLSDTVCVPRALRFLGRGMFYKLRAANILYGVRKKILQALQLTRSLSKLLSSVIKVQR